MTPKPIESLDDVIATYLEGLHNPTDDSLYNELRAKKDTEALKQALSAYITEQVRLARNEPVTIMGKSVDEIIVILSALEIERLTDIQVTMSNLDVLVKKMREDLQEATQKALNHAVSSVIDRAKVDRTAQLQTKEEV